MAIVKLSKEEFLKMVMARQRRKQALKQNAEKEIFDMMRISSNKGLKNKKRKLSR